jgi:hypothetical protein
MAVEAMPLRRGTNARIDGYSVRELLPFERGD